MQLAVARVFAPALGLLACVLLTGCDNAARNDGGGARASGLQMSGTVDGRQVAIRDGSPELIVGDCDPRTPPDRDVCAISQTVGGELFVLSIENPDVLEAGRRLDVRHADCRGPQCDSIDEFAVVDVQLGGGSRVRAQGGELHLDHVQPFVRYTGRLRLELPDGRVSGDFDLEPRRDGGI